MKKLCHQLLLETGYFFRESIIVLAGLFLIAGEVLGEVSPVPLKELAPYADQIVIGKVERKGEKTGEFWTQPVTAKVYEFFIATIAVETVIKGDPKLKEITVFYLTLGDTFGELILDRRSLFFVNEGRDDEPPWNKPGVMTTIGDVPIEGGWAMTGRIKGEPKRQPLNDLIKKIKSLLSLQ